MTSKLALSSSGMGRLKPAAMAVLKREAFAKLVADYLAGDIAWDNPSLKPVKDLVRLLLKAEQDETCPYCQRLIIPERRNLTEHIEHDEYRKFGLTATNPDLACPGCNVEKGTREFASSKSTAVNVPMQVCRIGATACALRLTLPDASCSDSGQKKTYDPRMPN